MDAIDAMDAIEGARGPAGPVAVRAWKPPVPGVREVLEARFAEHAYPPHTHDVWTLFLVDEGAVRYDLDRTERTAERAMVSLLPPHVVHDGRPATSDGYRKRAIYLETDVLGEHLVGRAVDRPFLRDPSLRGRVAALHDALGRADDAFEAEVRLHDVAERLRSAMGEATPDLAADARRHRDLAEALRAYLDERLFESPTMAEAAVHLGASPTQLARAFSDAFAIPPHAYVDGRRLEIARARILDGHPVGGRRRRGRVRRPGPPHPRFKRFLGTTPGQFGHGARSRTDRVPAG